MKLKFHVLTRNGSLTKDQKFWKDLRAKYIPEETRATVTNLFRVPCNVVVCVVLVYQGYMAVPTVFALCAFFHLGAAFAGHMLVRAQRKSANGIGREDEKEKLIVQ